MTDEQGEFCEDPEVRGEIAAAKKRVPDGLQGVYFYPWVGRNYWPGGTSGVRILVLGESHYAKSATEKPTPSSNCWCVAEHLIRKRLRFYGRVAVTLAGKALDKHEQDTLWNSLAFYNYVQKLVGVGARKRPTAEMWRESETGFTSVLESLKPHLILAFGKVMWDQLPKRHSSEQLLTIGNKCSPLREYVLDGTGAIPMVGFPHPSWPGFSSTAWHPIAKASIERVGKEISRED